MADLLVRAAGPVALGTSATTVYTVPASTRTALRSLRVVNEGASAATFTVSIGADAAGKRVFYQQSVQPGDSFDWSGNLIMVAAEVLQAYASATTTLTLVVSGVESS